MRGQYRALNVVGGLTIETLSLNLIRELKVFTNNLKSDLQDSMFQTLQAFNIASSNQGNINPNISSQPPVTQY